MTRGKEEDIKTIEGISKQFDLWLKSLATPRISLASQSSKCERGEKLNDVKQGC